MQKSNNSLPDEQSRLLKKQELLRKQKEVEELEAEIRFKESLPHIWGKPHYQWSRDFLECRLPEAFVCAANQIGKSSVLIRTCVEWATNKEKWPELWPGKEPNLFWYFYPDYSTATEEFHTKWQEWLPRGASKNSAEFGWHAEFARKEIRAIVFNSGIRVVFKAYSQKDTNIQASSVFACFLDEECPIGKLPEIQVRLQATDGYLRAGFTATIGQDYWRRVFEPQGPDEELHPDAWKKQVSLYDCQTYEDGSPGPWNEVKIKRAIARCGSKTEELRRVWGKFVVSGGIKYESFDREKNTIEPHPLPRSWHIYAGIDYGSGGERGHPAAIVFVGVSPDYKSGRVFRAWRGDGQITTASDIIQKYIEMKGNLLPIVTAYDYSAKDLHTYASERGHTLVKADKSQDSGVEIINTLFRNEMLKVQRGDAEREKLIVELTSVLKTTPKTSAKDDLCDAMRYASMFIPWNWEAVDEYINTHPIEGEIVAEPPVHVETREERVLRERRGNYDRPKVDSLDDELASWNELYDY